MYHHHCLKLSQVHASLVTDWCLIPKVDQHGRSRQRNRHQWRQMRRELWCTTVYQNVHPQVGLRLYLLFFILCTACFIFLSLCVCAGLVEQQERENLVWPSPFCWEFRWNTRVVWSGVHWATATELSINCFSSSLSGEEFPADGARSRKSRNSKADHQIRELKQYGRPIWTSAAGARWCHQGEVQNGFLWFLFIFNDPSYTFLFLHIGWKNKIRGALTRALVTWQLFTETAESACASYKLDRGL